MCRRVADIRDFKQIAAAVDSTAVKVGEVWGEYVTVARQNSILRWFNKVFPGPYLTFWIGN